MALSRDAYRELEDILGPENIAEDPVVLDSYSFNGTMTATSPGPEGRFAPNRPEAVVLPGSTKEVQAVIKWCNRRGMKSRAFGSGYGRGGTIECENAILLDLRRMNRILEIDEKNMHIVVEPYVCFAQVQAEAHKRGLNCHVIAAGSQPSFLASMTSVQGTNAQAISHGWSGRNLLGVEWVLPTGEILRLGAPGSGAGWFSGDGPGPSLRGIMRGSAGASGGLGVFTKCAAHLHPWPGPPEMKITGVAPYYETAVPPLFEYLLIEWPSWERCADGIYKIGEAGIAFAMHKTGGPGTHGSIITTSNNEFWQERQAHPEWILPWVSYAVVTAGNSPMEHEYQRKVLDRILADTGGKILPLCEEPTWRNRDYLNMVKMCFVPRSAFRLAGAFACPLQAMESVGHCAMGLSLDKEFRKKYDERGVLGNDGTNNMWGVPFEGGHWSIFECGHNYSPTDEESFRGMEEMMEEGDEIALKTPLGPFLRGTGDEGANKYGPLRYNFHHWMRKVKKTFDPNNASDPTNYIWVKEA
jgi:glycolate oxidase